MDGAESSGRTRFGAELRAQRNSRQWTQVDLGNELGYSGSFVSDVERGDRGPSEDFAGRCDKTFALPGTFLRLWEDLQREAFPTWFAPVVPLEREAIKIEGWELGAVPGLLQTEAYARSLVRASRPGDSEEAVENTVQARVERQAILAKAKPPMVFYVVSEAVLRQCIGGTEIMSAQLDRLIKAAETPGIVIQVLPFSAQQHAGVDGLLYLYDRPSEPLTGYSECIGGARLITDHQEVSGLATVMGMLRAASLSPWDSVALMRTIRRDLEQR
ncbi:MAG: helix-turn-helix domain-containing protein [Streptosporangiales bacterium]|jgi:transcriptional regulator with XRE-family HTH domain|nr:helix-turn-helix domain-containing protein [Streptosporangiales bacterium]